MWETTNGILTNILTAFGIIAADASWYIQFNVNTARNNANEEDIVHQKNKSVQIIK